MIDHAVPAHDAPGTVYIVDDDEAVRDSVFDLLQACGWYAQAFGSAEAFLASYRRGERDCLVLDLHMPGVSGATLEERLRAQGDDIAVIVISAYREDPLVSRARAAGAACVLTKPFDTPLLLAEVEAAVGVP